MQEFRRQGVEAQRKARELKQKEERERLKVRMPSIFDVFVAYYKC